MGEIPIIWTESDPVALKTKTLTEKCVLHNISLPYLQLLPHKNLTQKAVKHTIHN